LRVSDYSSFNSFAMKVNLQATTLSSVSSDEIFLGTSQSIKNISALD